MNTMATQPVSTLMSGELVTAGPDDTAQALAAMLCLHQVSCIPVVEEAGAVLGIVTENDLLKLEAARRDPAAVHAWEICTYKPMEVDASIDAGEVARIMVERRIHHVIVTQDKQLKGVVSSLDFVRQFVPNDPA